MSEHDEQAALFTWAAYQSNIYPELTLLHAIPNGGKRHIGTAVKMKAEGVRAGVPDVFLPVARGGYHGLYIEMKDGKKRPSEVQMWWLAMLENEGYRAEVAYSCDDAQAVILDYLSLPDAITTELLEAVNAALRAENNKLRFLNAVAEKAFDEGGATLDRASDKIESLLAENAALRARIDDCAAALMVDAEGR